MTDISNNKILNNEQAKKIAGLFGEIKRNAYLCRKIVRSMKRVAT